MAAISQFDGTPRTTDDPASSMSSPRSATSATTTKGSSSRRGSGTSTNGISSMRGSRRPSLPADVTVRIMVVGSGESGKTCLVKQWVDGTFDTAQMPTLGSDKHVKYIAEPHTGKRIKVEIWDTSGQPAFEETLPTFFKGQDGVLLVYDVTDVQTFRRLPKLVEMVSLGAPSQAVKLVAGNRTDLTTARVVSREQAEVLCEAGLLEAGIKHMETSARDSAAVRTLFNALLSEIFIRRGLKELEDSPLASMMSTPSPSYPTTPPPQLLLPLSPSSSGGGMMRKGESLVLGLHLLPGYDWLLDNGSHPMHLAAAYGSTAVITTLLKAGEPLEPRDANGRTPVHVAAGAGRLSALQRLVKEGADLLAQDSCGRPPLSWANTNEMKEYLREAGERFLLEETLSLGESAMARAHIVLLGENMKATLAVHSILTGVSRSAGPTNGGSSSSALSWVAPYQVDDLTLRDNVHASTSTPVRPLVSAPPRVATKVLRNPPPLSSPRPGTRATTVPGQQQQQPRLASPRSPGGLRPAHDDAGGDTGGILMCYGVFACCRAPEGEEGMNEDELQLQQAMSMTKRGLGEEDIDDDDDEEEVMLDVAALRITRFFEEVPAEVKVSVWSWWPGLVSSALSLACVRPAALYVIVFDMMKGQARLMRHVQMVQGAAQHRVGDKDLMLVGTYSSAEYQDDGTGPLATAIMSVRALLPPDLIKRLVHWGERPLLLLPLLDGPPPEQSKTLLREIVAVTVRGLGLIRKKHPALSLNVLRETTSLREGGGVLSRAAIKEVADRVVTSLSLPNRHQPSSARATNAATNTTMHPQVLDDVLSFMTDSMSELVRVGGPQDLYVKPELATVFLADLLLACNEAANSDNPQLQRPADRLLTHGRISVRDLERLLLSSSRQLEAKDAAALFLTLAALDLAALLGDEDYDDEDTQQQQQQPTVLMPIFPLQTQPPLPKPGADQDDEDDDDEEDEPSSPQQASSSSSALSPAATTTAVIICVFEFPSFLPPGTLARALARGLRVAGHTFMGFRVRAAPLGVGNNHSQPQQAAAREGGSDGLASVWGIKYYASAVEIDPTPDKAYTLVLQEDVVSRRLTCSVRFPAADKDKDSNNNNNKGGAMLDMAQAARIALTINALLEDVRRQHMKRVRMVLRLPADATASRTYDLTEVLLSSKTLLHGQEEEEGKEEAGQQQQEEGATAPQDHEQGEKQPSLAMEDSEKEALPSAGVPLSAYQSWGRVHETMPDWTYLPLPRAITTTTTTSSSTTTTAGAAPTPVGLGLMEGEGHDCCWSVEAYGRFRLVIVDAGADAVDQERALTCRASDGALVLAPPPPPPPPSSSSLPRGAANGSSSSAPTLWVLESAMDSMAGEKGGQQQQQQHYCLFRMRREEDGAYLGRDMKVVVKGGLGAKGGNEQAMVLRARVPPLPEGMKEDGQQGMEHRPSMVWALNANNNNSHAHDNGGAVVASQQQREIEVVVLQEGGEGEGGGGDLVLGLTPPPLPPKSSQGAAVPFVRALWTLELAVDKSPSPHPPHHHHHRHSRASSNFTMYAASLPTTAPATTT